MWPAYNSEGVKHPADWAGEIVFLSRFVFVDAIEVLGAHAVSRVLRELIDWCQTDMEKKTNSFLEKAFLDFIRK